MSLLHLGCTPMTREQCYHLLTQTADVVGFLFFFNAAALVWNCEVGQSVQMSEAVAALAASW